MFQQIGPEESQCFMFETREEAVHQPNRANHGLFRASQQRHNFSLCVPTEEEANADRNGSEAITAATDNAHDFLPAPFRGTFWDNDNGPGLFPCKPVSRNAHSRKPPRRVEKATRLAANQGENATIAMRMCTLGPDVAKQSMGGQAVNSIAQRRSSAIECMTELGVDHRDRDESVGEYLLVRTR